MDDLELDFYRTRGGIVGGARAVGHFAALLREHTAQWFKAVKALECYDDDRHSMRNELRARREVAFLEILRTFALPYCKRGGIYYTGLCRPHTFNGGLWEIEKGTYGV